MRCRACQNNCGHPTSADQSRFYAWCRMCGAQFMGHTRCSESIRKLRDQHEESCTRVIIPHRREMVCE